MKADRTLGPCPDCGEDLLVRQSRQGSYFVGCDGFPDCEYTLPLPNQGEPTMLDERCDDHDLRHVKMLAGRSTFVHGCPRCEAEDADETEDRVIGTCPDCGSDHDGGLAIKRLRNGSRLVGCTRYPDCEYSVPLPRRGDVEVTDRTCAAAAAASTHNRGTGYSRRAGSRSAAALSPAGRRGPSHSPDTFRSRGPRFRRRPRPHSGDSRGRTCSGRPASSRNGGRGPHSVRPPPSARPGSAAAACTDSRESRRSRRSTSPAVTAGRAGTRRSPDTARASGRP